MFRDSCTSVIIDNLQSITRCCMNVVRYDIVRVRRHGSKQLGHSRRLSTYIQSVHYCTRRRAYKLGTARVGPVQRVSCAAANNLSPFTERFVFRCFTHTHTHTHTVADSRGPPSLTLPILHKDTVTRAHSCECRNSSY